MAIPMDSVSSTFKIKPGPPPAIPAISENAIGRKYLVCIAASSELSASIDVELNSGNIFIRKMRGKAGQKLCPRHQHNFDHTTIVFTGAVRAKKWSPEGKLMYDRQMAAPHHFLIEADHEHEFWAVTDSEVWCVYSHRSPQGDVVQDYNGWEDAYN